MDLIESALAMLLFALAAFFFGVAQADAKSLSSYRKVMVVVGVKSQVNDLKRVGENVTGRSISK